jgi:hypothetical protein
MEDGAADPGLCRGPDGVPGLILPRLTSGAADMPSDRGFSSAHIGPI